MENLTDFNKTSFTFRRGVWINETAFNSVFVAVSLYLLIILVYYQVKIEKINKVKFLQLTLERKYVALSKYACIAIAVLSVVWFLARLGFNTLEGFIVFPKRYNQQGSATEAVCNTIPLIGGFALSLGNFFVYVFLWLRQSIFYVHSSLKVLYNTCLKVFNFSVLILYFFFGISLLSAYLIKVQYTTKKAGFCQLQISSGDEISYLRILIAWNIASILMQLSLLGLFIYPILKQASWQNKLSRKGKKKKSLKNVRMLRRVKKSVILALVCLSTDVLTAVSIRLAFKENTNTSLFMYGLNLVINHLVTIICFDYWKKMLWPWNTKCLTVSKKSIADETSVSSQQTINRCNFSTATVIEG